MKKNVRKIVLENRGIEKEFFLDVRESGKARKISLKIKSSEKLEIILPKKNILNALSLKFFSTENFVESHKDWVFKNSKKFKKQENKIPLSLKNWKEKKERFLEIAKERVKYFNQFYNFKYKNIFVKDTKSRWGSCSSVGNLNFNYRIFLLEPEQRDYVIVHELCHLKEMNHGKNFWDLVEKKSPNHKNIRRGLKRFKF